MEFTTKLFWFKDDSQAVDREHTTEAMARAWAAKRSAEVAGHCEVLHYGSVIADYVGGVDAVAAVAVQ